jgi:hypothetical protein
VVVVVTVAHRGRDIVSDGMMAMAMRVMMV